MAHGIIGNYHHSVVAMLAHLLFLTTAVLMLVWLLHYRGGINIQSEDPDQVFNVYMLCFYRSFSCSVVFICKLDASRRSSSDFSRM
jgi:hypothetical protein